MKVDINNVQLTIKGVQYEFHEATYNGLSIIQEAKTSFINASKFARDNKKRLGRLFESKNWKNYIRAFELEYKDELAEQSTVANLPSWSFKLNEGIPDSLKQIRGQYVHPKLINYIAIWCDELYAIKVGKIMDSINSRVHEQLKQQQLEDTPTNAQPIFNKQVQQITQMSLSQQNQQCWGVRDSPYQLDSNEQDDLKRDIEFYNKAKTSLLKAREAVESWTGFVNEYFPDFQF